MLQDLLKWIKRTTIYLQRLQMPSARHIDLQVEEHLIVTLFQVIAALHIFRAAEHNRCEKDTVRRFAA